MPVIRITEMTWDRLKQWAIPLEDSPEDAVKKVLEAAEEHLKCPQIKRIEPSTIKTTKRMQSKRLPKGLKTPDSAYYQPILEAIYELGSSAPMKEVLKVVEKKMKSVLKEVDYQKIPTGAIRWENTAQWARVKLIEDGLLSDSSESPKGIWKLSSIGLRQIEQKAKHSA